MSDERHTNQVLNGLVDLLKDAVSGIQIVAGDELSEIVEILSRQR